MARTNNLTNFLTDVATAIKTKKGDNTAIAASQFDTEIAAIQTGIDTSDATATAADLLASKTAYANGQKITGTIPVATALRVAPDGIAYKSNMGKLNVTHNINNDTRKYYTDFIQLQASSSSVATAISLTAEKIKKGVVILGITGTYEGLDTSDATATAGDILTGETAYVNGNKITGNLVINKYYTGSTAPSSSLGNDGDLYLQT